jgi:hypothetical protein
MQAWIGEAVVSELSTRDLKAGTRRRTTAATGEVPPGWKNTLSSRIGRGHGSSSSPTVPTGREPFCSWLSLPRQWEVLGDNIDMHQHLTKCNSVFLGKQCSHGTHVLVETYLGARSACPGYLGACRPCSSSRTFFISGHHKRVSTKIFVCLRRGTTTGANKQVRSSCCALGHIVFYVISSGFSGPAAGSGGVVQVFRKQQHPASRSFRT